MGEYERYRRALAGRRLPCAFVDLDRFDANAASLVRRAGGVPIRVVSKSLRCPALLRRALEHPGFAGIMAYSPAEAAWLHTEGFDDILVAYPSVERHDLVAVARRIIDHGARIRLVVDDPVQVLVLSQVAQQTRHDLPTVFELVIDIDMSLILPGLHIGVQRSPLRNLEGILALAALIGDTHGVELVGLMGYEAQVAGLADDLPGQRARNLALRVMSQGSRGLLHERRAAAVAALRAEGFELELVNGGGTGSLEHSRLDRCLTELAAGSGLLAPTSFDHYRDFGHHPALGFALPVVRRPDTGVFTCAGGGYVASGPVGRDRFFFNDPA
ncbi:MAG: alanine racemase, partial [Myxococcales bacterium]|nr:alanine racemase [Myxococcales bacterium]